MKERTNLLNTLPNMKFTALNKFHDKTSGYRTVMLYFCLPFCSSARFYYSNIVYFFQLHSASTFFPAFRGIYKTIVIFMVNILMSLNTSLLVNILTFLVMRGDW